MSRRRLYLLLQPETPELGARVFRLVHHLMIAVGIAVMLAATVRAVADAYSMLLQIGFYLVALFFFAEYILRLYVAPEIPGGEHRGVHNARRAWALSLPGIYDLVAALPAFVALAQVPEAGLFAFVWVFKYVRFSPGLAGLGRVISNARQALLSVLL